MNQPDNQDLDVDALMRQIKMEIAGRTARTRVSGEGPSGTNRPGTGDRGAFDGERVSLPRLAESAAAIPRKGEYTVRDFLNYHDEDFVRNAYRGVLRREPDAEGARRFLGMLRTGDFAKVEILGRIRFSPEGRAAGVRVTGLLFPFAMRTLHRIPVLGHILGIIQYILRLPNIVRSHERLETVVFLHQLEMRRGVNAIDAEIEAALQRLQDLIAGSIDAIEGKITGLERATSVSLDEAAQHLLVNRQDLLEQERRLGILLEDSSKRPPGVLEVGQTAAVLEERDHLFDGFYVSFEDTFRGKREDIKQRVAVYLPYVRAAAAGTAKAPILDIGCGRGEWLEVLKDNGLAASGVDLNRITAAHCRERGLEVAEADALDYLRGLETASIGAVTAIHVIEHLPFRQMMLLFDEVRRVLKPGGVAIFETPNPENLIVGACNFWYDPTHHRPLPPEPMQFILDNRGFTRVEILRLHPTIGMSAPAKAQNQLPAEIAERFYGPRDYALIGYKS
jgi:O-antigen chain-terminating methyltransferase